jgi:outer membrane biosynthesis protein TonB
LRRCLSRDPVKRPTLSDIEAQCRPNPLEQVVAALEQPTSDYRGALDAASGAPHGVARSRLWVPVVSAITAVAIISFAAWVSTRSIQTHGEADRPDAEAAAGAGASSASGSGVEVAGADASSANGSNIKTAGTGRSFADGSSIEPTGAGRATADSSSSAATGAGRATADSSSAEAAGAGRLAADGSNAAALSANASSAGPTSGVGRAGAAQADVGRSGTGRSSPPAKSGNTHGADQSMVATALAANVGGVSSAILHEVTPEVARNIRERIRGHINVAVRVLVDRDGNVVGQFLESPGPSRYFARVAGDAAQEWKFVPVEGQGSRVWLLRFQFDRAGATVNASGAQ